MSLFNNKIIIVTGGSEGIGASVSRLFLESKAKVYVFDIQKPAYQSRNLHFIHCDVKNINDINASVKTVIDENGRVDVLISNDLVPLLLTETYEVK